MDRGYGIVTTRFELRNVGGADAMGLDGVNVDDEAILRRVSKMRVTLIECGVRRDEAK
jgi:hypothetical protein